VVEKLRLGMYWEDARRRSVLKCGRASIADAYKKDKQEDESDEKTRRKRSSRRKHNVDDLRYGK